jgi:hypothetical protein
MDAQSAIMGYWNCVNQPAGIETVGAISLDLRHVYNRDNLSREERKFS